MLLRFRSPDGAYRVEVQPSDTVANLTTKLVETLPKDVNADTIVLSDKPANGQTRPLRELLTMEIGTLGLKHGDLLFLTYSKAEEMANGNPPAAAPGATSFRLNGQTITPAEDVSHIYTRTTAGSAAHDSTKTKGSDPWERVAQDPVDEQLEKLDGKIPRGRDAKMCRHGAKGMCDYCMPLEPYDQKYLDEKKIKHLSFHAHLRKTNTTTNKPENKSSYMPPLSEPYYSVKKDCPNGHPGWPEGICTKCQPSAITLQQQTFRMVDHVEFADSALINNFIDYWRRSGCQRIGYLYGRYAPYPEIPLGTKVIVEAIFEPPQVSETDGVTLELPWEAQKDIDEVAALCGLKKVGVIFTDLVDDGSGKGTVVCKRHRDSYFLSSLEIQFAARMQAENPNPCKWSETGKFGSKFVTCVVTGTTENQIEVQSYQVSNSAVEMVKADLIEPCAQPELMLVCEETKARYVPEVFFSHINEYGRKVQENAKPAFPVEYLLVTLTHGYPIAEKADPMFKSPSPFPIENREMVGVSQDLHAVGRQLGVKNKEGPPGGIRAVSDFHLLCYIIKTAGWGVLSQDEATLLAHVAATCDEGAGSALVRSGGWATALTILRESGEQPLASDSFSSSSSFGSGAVYGDKGRKRGSGENNGATTGERLAKRMKNFSIKPDAKTNGDGGGAKNEAIIIDDDEVEL